MQRITERQNHIVITNRMWARLLSSTNQPSFLDAKGDNEEKEEEEALNQLPDGHCAKDTSLASKEINSSIYPTAC